MKAGKMPLRWVFILRSARIVSLAILALGCAGGCGVFRGIPSHGGGKRFDEEQRVVAGAIRKTLADMDLKELENKRVAINVECISQDGAATVSFPGINNINAGLSGSYGSGNLVQINPSTPGGPTVINDNSNRGGGGNAGINYQPMVSYSPAAMSSMPDLGYFRAALEMKARHANVKLTPGPNDADAVLFVLVDVLGTNRSHGDNILTTKETLLASCEVSYYATDIKSGSLLFSARRASAEGMYREIRHFGSSDAIVDRHIKPTEPTPLPVDAPRKPTSQPAADTAVAKKKPWFDQIITRLAGAGD
jgi:hypothetical protein